MENFKFNAYTEMLFGKGQIEKLPEVINRFGKNVLLAYGGGSIKKNGIYDNVKKLLNDYNIIELDKIEPNPKIETVRRGVNLCKENNIDVILVPGLAFDRNGGRMGFGKGYYDRLLESSKAVKIGLCYDFQILEKIPTESHDVPMNFVITEKEILEIR